MENASGIKIDSMEGFIKDICILIPAYNPGEFLVQLVSSLIKAGFSHIIVVNDGSIAECMPIFERIKKMEQCHLLRHAVNLGKGRALKTGQNYFLLNFPNSPGLITCDADGQHRIEDVVKVAKVLQNNRDSLIIGVRDFDKEVPLRSKFGNVITRGIFFLLVGKYLSDTQSGLRGIPVSFVPLLIRMDGEGYEYEMNMLIATKTQGVSIIEEQISTIYIDNNRSSHFNPLLDSMKIYFLLLRFSFSSILASLFDFIIFSLSYKLTSNVLLSIFIGRYTIGPFINYSINRNTVFHHKGRIGKTLIRYYLFATIMGICAAFLIRVATYKLSISVIAAKILVETFLFIVSFTIQRDYIFAQRTPFDSLSKSEQRER